MNYTVPQHISSNKIFIANRSELEDRIDPEMNLYNKEVQHFKYETVELKKLLVKSPQYGANESGIQRLTNSEPRYIRITDIDEYGQLNDDIGVTAEKIENKYILNDNDILFARSGATVGKCYLHKSNSVGYVSFFAGYMIRFVVDTKKVLPEYLFFYTQLGVYKRWVKAIQRAAGQPNINAEEYKSLPIPLLPLHEQQLIVEAINLAYTKKKDKEAEAKILLASIDAYLLSELGITIPEKDNSLQNRIFTTSYTEIQGNRIDSYFYQKDFLEFFANLKNANYPVLSLKKISKRITSGITPLSGGDAYTNSTEGIPFIRSGNIDINGDLNFDDLLYLKKDVHFITMKSSQLKYNDLMIAIVGATIGQVGIYKSDREANINQAIALVRLHPNHNPDFIKELIKSSIGQYNLNRLKRPVARANINLEEISTMKLVIPPIEKQNELAEKIAKIRLEAKKLYREADDILDKTKLLIEDKILGI